MDGNDEINCLYDENCQYSLTKLPSFEVRKKDFS